MKIGKMLLAVDGSSHSEQAARYTADLAQMISAEVILLHCHRQFPSVLGEPYLQQVVSDTRDRTERIMAPVRDILTDAGVPFSERLLEGPAGPKIVEVARIESIDLIIMGSKGKSDLEGLIMGSVTHRVLNAAPCPVLVVK